MPGARASINTDHQVLYSRNAQSLHQPHTIAPTQLQNAYDTERLRFAFLHIVYSPSFPSMIGDNAPNTIDAERAATVWAVCVKSLNILYYEVTEFGKILQELFNDNITLGTSSSLSSSDAEKTSSVGTPEAAPKTKMLEGVAQDTLEIMVATFWKGLMDIQHDKNATAGSEYDVLDDLEKKLERVLENKICSLIKMLQDVRTSEECHLSKKSKARDSVGRIQDELARAFRSIAYKSSTNEDHPYKYVRLRGNMFCSGAAMRLLLSLYNLKTKRQDDALDPYLLVQVTDADVDAGNVSAVTSDWTIVVPDGVRLVWHPDAAWSTLLASQVWPVATTLRQMATPRYLEAKRITIMDFIGKLTQFEEALSVFTLMVQLQPRAESNATTVIGNGKNTETGDIRMMEYARKFASEFELYFEDKLKDVIGLRRK